MSAYLVGSQCSPILNTIASGLFEKYGLEDVDGFFNTEPMDSISSKISKRIDAFMVDRGITRTALAKAIGLPKSQVSDLLNCKAHVRWNIVHLEKVARFLKLPLSLLVSDTEDYMLDPQDTLLVRAYHKLDANRREVVDTMLSKAKEELETLLTTKVSLSFSEPDGTKTEFTIPEDIARRMKTELETKSGSGEKKK